MTETIIQMVVSLAFVILVIILLAFVYRKRQKVSGLVNLLSYQSFGQKIGIAAIKVDDEILVLGVTPNDIKLLKKIDENPAKDKPEQAANIAEKVKKLKELKEDI